jgi:hypothetical protein
VLVGEPSYEIDGELSEVLARANVELRDADDAEALRGVAVDIARRLQVADWPDSVLRHDDFVVMAVDADLIDVERNLADLLAPDRFEELKRRGLI